MQKANILDAIKIINDTVKKFEGSRRFLSTGDLDFTVIKGLENVTYINRPSRANQNVQKGDIILARMQGTVKVNIIDSKHENIIVSTGFLVLRCKKDVYNRYLFHYLKSNLFQSKKDKLCSGATQKAINNNKFAEIQIPLPDLTTQQKIATILDKADELRQYNQQLIEKYDTLTQSLFLEMFGDPVKNEKGWEMKNGIQYCEKISVGVVIKPASYYVDNGIIALRSLNIKPNRIDLKELVYFSKKVSETTLAKSQLKMGDVVIVRTGSTGTAAIIPKELDNANCIDLIITRPNISIVNPMYLVYFFNSERGKNIVSGHEVGGIQKHFNIGSIKNLDIPIPPVSLQNQFADRIQIMEAQKQQAQEALAKSEALFQGLLQQAFKGELN